jgi:hypothetical protein
MTSWPTMKELTTGIHMTASTAHLECLGTVCCGRGGGGRRDSNVRVFYVTKPASDSIVERMNMDSERTLSRRHFDYDTFHRIGV